MLCEKCKTNTIVIDGVDNRDTDETYRLRVCPKCGRTFYTVEFPVEKTERFAKDWVDHHKNHSPINKGEVYYSKDGVKKLLNKIHKTNKRSK